MLNQRTLVINRAAVIFVLFLASASLASANPICKCQNGDVDSPSRKVVDYNVQISESREEYNETIEVDTEKQTELFKVPAHLNVDQSNILHDFKTNLSMLLLPKKKICYLLPLDKELPTPAKLINDLDEAQRRTISEKTVIDNKWTVHGEVTDRSALSDELAAFCAKYPIYSLKEMEDTMTSTRIQTDVRKHRQRRRIPIHFSIASTISNEYEEIPDDILCSGAKKRPSGMDVWKCSKQYKKYKVQCRIVSRTCYTFRVCDNFDSACIRHIWNTIDCCEYLCM